MEASSEFFGYFDAANNGNNVNNNNGGGSGGGSNFVVDDLLDFSKEDDDVMTDAFFDTLTTTGNSANSSTTVTAVDSSNSGADTTTDTHFNGSLSSRSFTDTHFSATELCVPYDDLAELEWLSTFMEDSLSSDDMQNLQFIPTTGKTPFATTTDTSSSSITTNTTTATTKNTYNNTYSTLPIFSTDVAVPGKARSKRSRAAPCDWSSRLLHLSPATSSTENNDIKPILVNHTMISNNFKPTKIAQTKRRECTDTVDRKCLHCGSDKTPQWRTGPMGPKTLCNACGVRYKSGRLVPEYRPAASPTFVSAKHSNSHRKVVELRRQKELQRHHMIGGQTSMFGVSNGGDHDYVMHHHQQQINGPDYRHMI